MTSTHLTDLPRETDVSDQELRCFLMWTSHLSAESPWAGILEESSVKAIKGSE